MQITVQHEDPQPTPVQSVTLVLTPQEFRLLRQAVGQSDTEAVVARGFDGDALYALYQDLREINV